MRSDVMMPKNRKLRVWGLMRRISEKEVKMRGK
jgi:hypothetical protein